MQGRVTRSAVACARRLANHSLVLVLGAFLLSSTPASATGGALGAIPTLSLGAHGNAASAPPTITTAKFTSNFFRVSALSTAVSAAETPIGSALEFSLSQPAALRIVITHPALGLSQGGLCLRPSFKLRRANAKSCARILAVGVLRRASEAAGADTVTFSGRIGRTALAPGVYRAILQARNGNGVSARVTLTFSIVL